MSSKIEWLRDPITGKPGYTINPVKGLCPVGCSYCYARRLYKRFHLYKDGTPNPTWDYAIRYDENVMLDQIPDKPSRIFVGSTIELFGEWVKPEWLEDIFSRCRDYLYQGEKHTFIFLTKRPENLSKWSPFPENCWVGVSATNAEMFITAGYAIKNVNAAVKFISVEPFLEWQHGEIGFIATMLRRWGINWLIIGQQTPVKASTSPKVEWVREIVEAADINSIPVFLKDNLRPLFIPEDCRQPNALMDDIFWANEKAKLRQEFPVVLAERRG